MMRNNSTIWNGRAAAYSTVRPQPPAVILDMFTQLIQQKRPRLVVDLGSGTGLSTLLWSERAERVVGIEPNEDMRNEAEKIRIEAGIKNVSYRKGVSTATGLGSSSADIVTCSQSLHWMEPAATFAEVERILRPGGLFAAYDYDWPPTVSSEAEEAYQALMERIDAVSWMHDINEGATRWPKHQHLARMQASECFHYVKEIRLHHREMGDADRFIGLILSSHISALIKRGLSPQDIDLATFEYTVREAIGTKMTPFWFSYHVRIGVV